MSEFEYGPTHRWFAWRPVNTDDRGWRWLRLVWRQRVTLYHDDFRKGRWFNYVVKRERDLMERGRRLASERDDLIADGADPIDLIVPRYPRDGR